MCFDLCILIRKVRFLCGSPSANVFAFYCLDVCLWAASSAVVLYLLQKMFLRPLWCRSGTQLFVESKPVFSCALTSISRSLQPLQYECKPRTPGVRSEICSNTLHHQENQNVGQVLAASGGVASFAKTSLSCGVVATCAWGQKRLYSTSPVNLILKPSLKSAVVPGKRVPKGPRTKQPSRTNQPSLKEDKVADRTTPGGPRRLLFEGNSNLLLSAGYDAVYRLRNGRSVSLTNTLP